MAARDSQTGLLVPDQGTPKDRVGQAGVLVADQGAPVDRVGQTGLLVADQGAPVDRVGQVGLLVADQGTPIERVGQTGLLVADQGTPNDRVGQTGLLVITVIGVGVAHAGAASLGCSSGTALRGGFARGGAASLASASSTAHTGNARYGAGAALASNAFVMPGVCGYYLGDYEFDSVPTLVHTFTTTATPSCTGGALVASFAFAPNTITCPGPVSPPPAVSLHLTVSDVANHVVCTSPCPIPRTDLAYSWAGSGGSGGATLVYHPTPYPYWVGGDANFSETGLLVGGESLPPTPTYYTCVPFYLHWDLDGQTYTISG